MWIVVMFDLPVETKQARRSYSIFRKSLLGDGFIQMQFSIYCRHSASQENANVHLSRVERNLPPDGEVRILTITDKQFERMRIFFWKKRKMPEPPPSQTLLF
jgi:CRISPR-associated protein Cas2